MTEPAAPLEQCVKGLGVALVHRPILTAGGFTASGRPGRVATQSGIQSKGRPMAAPTREDAQLMVQLAQWTTSLGFERLMPELLSDEFDPNTVEVGTSEAVRVCLMIGESIGTLTKHGLLSPELVYDWLWVAGIWERVGPAALKVRETFGEPRLYENFEALAKAAP
jgi:hypothetical protein